MPLKKCTENEKSGWKWGESGKCFTGPSGKKKAIKQGLAIEGPEKFSQKAYTDQDYLLDQDIKVVSDEMHEQDYSLAEITAVVLTLQSVEGITEEITESNFYIPEDSEYIESGEEIEEWDFAKDRPGLWENIRKKKEREGKNYRPAKKGDKDRPDDKSFKKAQSKKDFKPHIMYDKDGKPHQAKTYEDHVRMSKLGYTHKKSKAAEYQGRKVTLNKPFRTPDGPKKFAVYTKNGSGKVVIVRFGDPNMEIKRDNPKRRKSFRARHNCDNPGPKWKARYWSCKKW